MSAPPPEPVAIRPMNGCELDGVLDWAAAEGWNPGLGDADVFHATDPEGFLLALEGETPVGAIAAVRYPSRFGFIGLFLVRPDRRGRGIGRRLFEAALARLDGYTVGLDAVPEAAALYERFGFAPAYRHVRWGGTPAPAPPAGPAGPAPDPRLVPVAGIVAGGVVAFDNGLFPAARPAFLRGWLMPPRWSAALVEHGRVQGFGVMRACRQGHKVGPLAAASEGDADLLLRALLAQGRGGPVFLDVPEPNRAAAALAGRHGLSPVFEALRMYRGPAPSLPLRTIYGIASLELG